MHVYTSTAQLSNIGPCAARRPGTFCGVVPRDGVHVEQRPSTGRLPRDLVALGILHGELLGERLSVQGRARGYIFVAHRVPSRSFGGCVAGAP